jgi:hypothetical protein
MVQTPVAVSQTAEVGNHMRGDQSNNDDKEDESSDTSGESLGDSSSSSEEESPDTSDYEFTREESDDDGTFCIHISIYC